MNKGFGPIAYAARTLERPRFFANDHSRDTVPIDPVAMPLIDGRRASCTLDREGFALIRHASTVTDFADSAQSERHAQEIKTLVKNATGADHVSVTAPGVLRFSEASGRAGSLNNSHPARFAHVDTSSETARIFAANSAPDGPGFKRALAVNVWRCFSGAPQDVPLALCDARSVSSDDLITADAIFDRPGAPEWSFEAWVVAHNPTHRWHWFPDMVRDEVLIFVTADSDRARSRCVPHVAFDWHDCPKDASPRASVEMRAIAYWY